MEGLITSQLFVSLHVMAIVVHVILIGVAYSIYLERKISAYIQDRVGPNRVGFDFGQAWLRCARLSAEHRHLSCGNAALSLADCQ